MSDVITTIDGVRLTVGDAGVVCSEDDRFQHVDATQIELCVRWFSQAEATTSPSVNSFWLKHVIENWAGTFISNGAVILAAHQAGFPIGRDADNVTANVTVAVSPDSINEFDCGCGHP